MASDPFLVGVFFGFVPAMSLLYILLHRYQAFYQEKRAFAAFFIGIGVGLAATLLQIALAPARGASLMATFVNLALFALLTSLLMAAVLNSKRYRGRRDTPYYGVAFGLGFGALNVLFMIGNAVGRLGQGTGSALVDAISLSLLGLYFIGSILVHATVGAWIGRGSAHQRIAPAIVRSTAVETLYLLGLWALFQPHLGPFVPWAGLGLGLVLVRHTLRDVLDPIVPPEVRREMELHQRRLARSLARELNRPSDTDPDAPGTPDSPAPEPREPPPRTP